jgi:hypothetical protein
MKSSLEMLAVEAISPPTSMREFGPNRIPFWFRRMTLPFAVRLPRICEGSPPVTRFSVMEFEPGWMKLVVSPSPIENWPQLMMAFCVDWVMSRRSGAV